jgi:phosphoribosylaminoimidazolesuccinocarboxamide synthase
LKKFVPYATINPLIFQKSQQRQKAILKLENPGSYDDKERMRNMEKLDMLYEGKAKKVYKTDDENAYIVEYKDDATAFNGLKKGTIAGKGVINNKMSNLMFRLLEEKGIPTHYIEELSDRETAVRKVEIVPLEVIVRNIAAGSFSKRYGVPEGSELKCTILEYSYKNDDLGDPLINDLHAIALGLATREELDQIAEMTLAINEALKEIFLKVGIILVDFKIEFGRCPALGGKIILADEISPDTCRLWDAQTKEKLDKDRFRRDLGGVEEAYNEVFNKLFKKD